jgi:hypothetical protein
MRLTIVALLTVAGLAVDELASAQSLASISHGLGLQTYDYCDNWTLDQFDSVIANAQEVHAVQLRTDLWWADFTRPGADQEAVFKTYEERIEAIRSRGMFPVLVAHTEFGKLPWPVQPADQTTYANWITACYQHFGNVGICVGYEPNGETTDQSLITAYGNLVVAVGKAKKALKLPGEIIAPCVSTWQYSNPPLGGTNYLAFMSLFLATGAGDYVDLFSIDLYGNSSAGFSPESMSLNYPGSVDLLAPFLALIKGKPFVVTETGADSLTIDGSDEATREDDQASRVIRALLCFLSRGANWCSLFEIRDRIGWTGPPMNTPSEGYYGMLHHDLTPKRLALDLQKLMSQYGAYTVGAVKMVGKDEFQVTLSLGSKHKLVSWTSDATKASKEFPYDPVDSL